jgi:hypothetical protein
MGTLCESSNRSNLCELFVQFIAYTPEKPGPLGPTRHKIARRSGPSAFLHNLMGKADVPGGQRSPRRPDFLLGINNHLGAISQPRTQKRCSDIRSMTLGSDANLRKLLGKVCRVSVLKHHEFHPIRQKLGSDELHRLSFEVDIDRLTDQDDGIGCAAH